MTLKLIKQKNNNVAIFDDTKHKYVPLRGQNLRQAALSIKDDYFWKLPRKQLIEAVKIVFKTDEERLAEEKKKEEKRNELR